MRCKTAIRKPLFELGLKGYLYGLKAVQLARAANRISRRYEVTIVFTPQCVDVSPIAKAARSLFVFSQHLDPVREGKGSGSILAEAVKAAGAAGVLLNHSEKPMTRRDLALTVQRAKEVGLLTMVCANSPAEAAVVARLKPDMILAEPPELIGGAESVAAASPDFIIQAIESVRKIDPSILIFGSAGIHTPADAAAVILAGADGTGSSSGVLCSVNPAETLEQMVIAVKEAWKKTHLAKRKNLNASEVG